MYSRSNMAAEGKITIPEDIFNNPDGSLKNYTEQASILKGWFDKIVEKYDPDFMYSSGENGPDKDVFIHSLETLLDIFIRATGAKNPYYLTTYRSGADIIGGLSKFILEVCDNLLVLDPYFDAMEKVVYPFIEEGTYSFTTSLGPGDDISQYFPHDREYKENVFDKYDKNLIIIFEQLSGGVVSGFAQNYNTLFRTGGDVSENIFYINFMAYIRDVFGPESRVVFEHVNERCFLIKVNDNTRIILFDMYYYTYKINDSLERIATRSVISTVLCGIRPENCFGTIFNENSIFLKCFHFYIYTYAFKDIKNDRKRTGVNLKTPKEENSNAIIYNLKTIRENPAKFYPIVRAVTLEETYKTQILTELCSRYPEFCTVKNPEIFWRNITGGKRKHKKTRKHRKHRKHRKDKKHTLKR
jgi:hypothetical protein